MILFKEFCNISKLVFGLSAVEKYLLCFEGGYNETCCLAVPVYFLKTCLLKMLVTSSCTRVTEAKPSGGKVNAEWVSEVVGDDSWWVCKA